MARTSRRLRPSLDSLEGRRLLASGVRALSFTEPTGAHVLVRVFGTGSLLGSTVDADGGINLVYSGTNATSKIQVSTRGGVAGLRSLRPSAVPINDYTGVGGQLLGSVLAPTTILLPEGQINLTSGIGRLQLYSVAANSQVHLRELPQTVQSTTTASTATSGSTTLSTIAVTGTNNGSSSTAIGSGNSVGTTTGGSIFTGSGTSTTGTVGTNTGTSSGSTGTTTGTGLGVLGTTTGTTGTSSGIGGVQSGSGGTTTTSATAGSNTAPSATDLTSSVPGVTSVTTTTFTTTTGGNGNPVIIPAGETAVAAGVPETATAPTTYTDAGRVTTYSNSTAGASTLTSISGLFAPTANLITTPNPANPGTPPAPPGVIIQLSQVTGNTPASGSNIGDGEIFAYDPILNVLARFDTRTGASLQTINVFGSPTTTAGVGMGRNGRELVVLLARGNTVQAYDAVTGLAVGAFTTNNLAGVGLPEIDGVGYIGTSTILTDSNAQLVAGSKDYGVAQAIDVTRSLATGVAVPLGTAYPSNDGFEFSGGGTGVAGSNSLYVTGSAAFDSFQPNSIEEGLLTITGFKSGTPIESTVAAFSNTVNPNGTTPYVVTGTTGSARTNPVRALGSIEDLLAAVTSVTTSGNVVTLYSPSGLTVEGQLLLADRDPLVGLSESFHPELAGSALIDVQGAIQSFNAGKVNGLALNDSGNLNLVNITSLSNSTIVGQPLSHVNIGHRVNSELITPTRSVNTRGDVVVNPTIRPLGPLALPG